MKPTIAMALAALVLLGWGRLAEAKNVILMIGDGMGSAAVTAARIAKDPKGAGELFIDTLPMLAHVTTLSADTLVTDSAAAATALATGAKTRNGCIGFGPACDGRRPLSTIAEEAHRRGMAVGLVTTTRITHATPAGFYAHTTNRHREEEIARQLATSGVDLALGGGCRHVTPEVVAGSPHALVRSLAELSRLPPGQKAIGCFAESHLPYVRERKAQNYRGPTLVEMTKAALARLATNPNGFFLMVEGGRIDLAAHDNLARNLVAEVLEFDDAVRAVATATEAKETLLLVTADHDTGGLSLNGYPKRGADPFGPAGVDLDGKPYPFFTFATGPDSAYPRVFDQEDPRNLDAAHAGIDVPLYGVGLAAPLERGTIDNTAIFRLLKEALVIQDRR